MAGLDDVESLPRAGRNNTAAPQPDHPWTATRCHRLLRPLETHIAALKRELAMFAAGTAHRAQPQEGEAPSAGSSGSMRGCKRRSASDELVPARKKPRITYSNKRARRTALAQTNEHLGHASDNEMKDDALQPRKSSFYVQKEGVLPTPFKRRLRGKPSPEKTVNNGEDPGRSRRCQHLGCPKRCYFEDQLAILRGRVPTALCVSYEAVFRALDSTLVATRKHKTVSAAPQSLMAMCLRKIPKYIAELEAWQQQEALANGTLSTLDAQSASFEVYSELEGLGHGSAGWKYLMTVVRSHAVSLIKDLLKEAAVALEFSQLLIQLCRAMGCTVECRELCDILLEQQQKSLAARNSQRSLAGHTSQSILLQLVSPNWLWPSTQKLELLGGILTRELLPDDFTLDEDFEGLRKMALDALCRNNAQDAVMAVISGEIRCLSRLVAGEITRQSGSGQVQMLALSRLSRCIAVLVAIAFMPALKADQNSTTHSSLARPARQAAHIISISLFHAELGGATGTWICKYLLTVAAYLAVLSVKGDNHAMGLGHMAEQLWNDNSRRREEKALPTWATSELLSRIAGACALSVPSQSACDVLSKICSHVEELDMTGIGGKTFRVDTAFRLAEVTNDLRDLAFAEQLKDGARCEKTRPKHTPRKKQTSMHGFRWDDGISEWVTATPAPLAKGDFMAAVKSRPPVHDFGARALPPKQKYLISDLVTLNRDGAFVDVYAEATDSLPDTGPGVGVSQGSRGARYVSLDIAPGCDVDELGYNLENVQTKGVTSKAKASSRSTRERQPLRRISNQPSLDASSDDELGL